MESKVIAQQGQLRAPTDSYGFPSTGEAISGVLSLFFFLCFFPALIMLAINIIRRSKKNFLQNIGMSVLTGILSGIITFSVFFVTIYLVFNIYEAASIVVVCFLIFGVFFPGILTKIIGARYSSQPDRFLYGSAVYLVNLLVLFVIYRIALSMVTTSGMFGPTYY